MRTIPPDLLARLQSGATTLCSCWVLTRPDGQKLGFTDHDRDLVIDGVTCRAETGLSASEATSRFGLSVASTEIAGALSDAALAEDDLAAGRFDGAQMVQYLVDWSAPDLRVALAAATLGEVTREGARFTAELRGIAHRLAEEQGRLYGATCTADLGDARCGVALDAPAYRAAGTIVAVEAAAVFTVAGLDAYAAGWFTAGRFAFTAGAQAGVASDVKWHRTGPDAVRLALWQAPSAPVMPGDAFIVTAGCDKRFATCRDRFANALNFRGFPALPGNDFVMTYAAAGDAAQTGAALPSASK